MSDALSQGYIKSSMDDGLATIEFFHPLSNSLPSKLLAELAGAITEAGNNDAVKVVLLKSAPGVALRASTRKWRVARRMSLTTVQYA